jgi:hypothetical protein
MATAAAEVMLKEKLSQAQPGSYLVIEQNKIFTFLHIRDRLENSVIIEEVSIPAACYAKNPYPWKVWFEKGAPGNTSWLISQVNLSNGILEHTFSFTQRGWMNLSESNPFLTTLLNLRFREVENSQRRRIGTHLGYHKQDPRPFWHPRLIVDGRVVSNIPFCAFKARWPADGSELSRKMIEIYLPVPASDDNQMYPSYFPFWLEVDSKIGSAKARVIDSGFDAVSPRNTLPKKW